MFSSRDVFDEACPVKDDLLGAMYRASEQGLPQLVASVAPDVRAMLALFCYRRSHLHALAVSIASSCSELDLVRIGGRVGSTLFALSREQSTDRPAPSVSHGHRKPITLSTKPLSFFAPLEDIDDDIASDDLMTVDDAPQVALA